jgi:protein-S-isoprenylcysteine O-methyltransferase Ste14
LDWLDIKSGKRDLRQEQAMDSFRHFLAVLELVVLPPGTCFWLVIHPYARWWRKVGALRTYLALVPVWVVASVLLFQIRDLLIGRDLGTNWSLIAISSVFFAGMTALELQYWKYLSVSTLIGLPELSRPERRKGKLLREGVYGVVRHPRYLSAFLSLVGIALVSNYVGLYIFVLLLFPIGHCTMELEERELVERFGNDYRQYQREVPRLIPRFRRTC